MWANHNSLFWVFGQKGGANIIQSLFWDQVLNPLIKANLLGLNMIEHLILATQHLLASKNLGSEMDSNTTMFYGISGTKKHADYIENNS